MPGSAIKVRIQEDITQLEVLQFHDQEPSCAQTAGRTFPA
jgi:hypothetical protein